MSKPTAVRGGLLLFVVIAIGAGFAARSLQRPAVLLQEGSRLTIREGSVEYVFDAAWRVERLHVRTEGNRGPDLSVDRPEEVERLRGVLLRRLNVDRLEDIPEESEDLRERLRSLGYL